MPDEPTSDDPKSKSQNSENPSEDKPDATLEEIFENVSSEEIVDDILREQGAEKIVQEKDEGEADVEGAAESQESIDDSPLEIVGVMLRSAREAKRFSTADVARELMITQTFVDAIENAIVEKLPSRVYVRGYIASYADYVDAPKDEILKLFDKSHEGVETERSKRPASISGMKRRDDVKSFLSKNSPKILTALIIATIIGISSVIWYFWTSDAAVSTNSLPEIPSTGLDQSAQTEQEGSNLSDASDIERGLNVETDPSLPELDEDESNVIEIGDAEFSEENPLDQLDIPADTDTVLGTSSLITLEDRDSEEDSITTTDEASTSTRPDLNEEKAKDDDLDTPLENALALSENEAKLQRARAEGLPIGSLLIELKEECWIEVEDRYGDRIYNDLHHPNDTVLLSGVTPLKVTLGNAKGATMYYNGEKVELRPSVVTGVALVNLR